MPYIVENADGILISGDMYLGTSSLNIGTESDAAAARNCSVYLDDDKTSFWIQTGGGMIADNYYVNRGLILPAQFISTVSGGVSLVTSLFDHIIVCSFSTSNSNTIWLGTESRVEGKELIFRRVDGTTASVTIRSSQTDIDDGLSTTADVSQLTLTNTGLIRLVRINGVWVRMNFAE